MGQLTETVASAIRKRIDEERATPLPGVMNMTLPASQWLYTACDHEVHYKGQFVHGRMNGIDPLFFIARSCATNAKARATPHGGLRSARAARFPFPSRD